MNGFTNAILTLLLGWLRSLFNAVWTLLGSDRSVFFIDFFRQNWKMIFLVMCVGGFVIDRIIYLIRWRPDYVWKSRRMYRRGSKRQGSQEARARREDAHAYPEPDHSQDWAQEEPAQQTMRYRSPAAQPYVSQETQPYRYSDAANGRPYAPPAVPAPAQSTFASRNSAPDPYSPNAYPASGYAPAAYPTPASPGASGAYPGRGAPSAAGGGYPYAGGPVNAAAPSARGSMSSFAPTSTYQAVSYQAPLYSEPLADDLRYDDDPNGWEEPIWQPMQSSQAMQPDPNPAAGMVSKFGSPQPEPLHALQDMQATFAPKVAPEPYYPAGERAPFPPEPPPARPVHPGLDLETFHQNIGLTQPDALTSARANPADAYPDFVPYSEAAQIPDGEPAHPRLFGSLAKRARTFVSGEDERNPRSIHDMQPTVDVKNAFHSPVYPRKKSESEEE